MKKEKSKKDWEKEIIEFKSSGKTQSAWCREKGISLRRFNYWYCKSKNNNSQNISTNWITFESEKTELSIKSSIINIKIGTTIIETNPEMDVDHLSKILKVVDSIC